jgi:DNA invertase Pin-like site-specific DNA recombinase
MTVAYYARFSCEKGDNESVANQFSIMKSYVEKQNDFENANFLTYKDEGFSGINLERPAFQEMLTAVRMRKINCIIVKDLSRLGRNYLDVCKLTDSVFPFMNVRVIAVSDNYDSKNNAGQHLELAVTFKSVLNEFHVTETSEKVRKYFKYKLLKGEFMGFLPYGYFFSEQKKPLIDAEKAEIVKEIFKLKLDGNSSSQIAGIFNAKKIPSCFNKKWLVGMINSILQNKAYIGTKISHKRISDLKTKQTRKATEDELIIFENIFPPIIEPKMFNDVQVAFKQYQPKNNASKHIMANKVFCKKCGFAISRSKNFFSCKNSYITGEKRCFEGLINVPKLYDAVLQKVKYVIAEELAKYKTKFSFSEMEQLENFIEILKEKRTKILEEHALGEISERDFLSEKKALTSKISEANAKIEDFEKSKAMAMRLKFGNRDSPINTLKKLYNAENLTEMHMKFIKKIVFSTAEDYEIMLEPDDPLTVLCKNISIYEEV